MSKMSELYTDIEILIEQDLTDAEIVYELRKMYPQMDAKWLQHSVTDVRESVSDLDNANDAYPEYDEEEYLLPSDQLQW